MARQPQPVVDLVGLVQMRVVDQPLPSHRGARLLEVDAHRDAEPVGELCDDRLQQRGILARRLRVVNGAGADDDQKTRVARCEDGGRGRVGDGQLLLQEDRRKHHLGPLDAKIICALVGRHASRESLEPRGVRGVQADPLCECIRAGRG